MARTHHDEPSGSSTAWPVGVIARYRTIADATVDIQRTTEPDATWQPATTECTGCGTKRLFINIANAEIGTPANARTLTETEARDWAQQHSEKCRAEPKPTDVSA
ncbi:hypothetical protein [Kitasatospora sp. NPDC001175]|uniref:hypothetical protein n=1 Tax=Kitasatospora sp. NPDC001175 TaxID=3157103 RepID=UPI003CFC012F